MDLSLLSHPLVQGVVTGILSAASVDFVAFRSWKSFSEAYAYDWPIAFWRWSQGAVVGFVAAAGLGWVS